MRALESNCIPSKYTKIKETDKENTALFLNNNKMLQEFKVTCY